MAKNFVEALHTEIKLRQHYLAEPVNTIYFGGGTPSILAGETLSEIVEQLRSVFMVMPSAEITLEANPDDINSEKLLQWSAAGFNRLSIGVQSFNDADLKWMNRAHNSNQAVQSIKLAQQFGFENFSLDLIYGTPTLTDVQWRENVEQAIGLGAKHLSCYALTVEPKTSLQTLIRQKKLPPVDEEKQAMHFELLLDWMEVAGYEHYEISNFALPGFRSKHNSSYWQQQHYIGLGPSAHSYNGVSRQWNVANNSLYISGLQQNNPIVEVEVLTVEQQLNEYIMTGLRTTEGLNLQYIKDVYGELAISRLEKDVQSYLTQQLIVEDNNHLSLSRPGKLRADGIAAALFQL